MTLNIRSITKGTITFLFLAFTSFSAIAQEDAAREEAMKIKAGWLSNPVIITALQQQNTAHQSLGEAEILAKDTSWRQEVQTGGGALTKSVLGKPVSDYLRSMRDQSGGLYTELFVMDNKGLNVGQSDLTSDYWQGDEAKWQQTYQVGPDGVHVGDIEFDESSQSYQVQVSIAISDDTGVIGAITIGMNAEML